MAVYSELCAGLGAVAYSPFKMLRHVFEQGGVLEEKLVVLVIARTPQLLGLCTALLRALAKPGRVETLVVVGRRV